jgi:hypothetical protein|tara:strand:- start:379 stop:624 length:246 start_codon:yes stop_codon:yes gene_type:complete
MPHNRLRIYCGPEEQAGTALQESDDAQNTVTLPLAEIFPMLADALVNQRCWPQDFADDEVTISSDLYEVILAYEHHRRPSA